MAQATEKTDSLELIAAPAIEKRIFVVRGRQVMLDEDLADLYGVETRRLIEQVKRNRDRFPGDFMFQLSKTEAAVLRSQIAISNSGSGGRRYAPYVFTEQGVAMLSGVLRSKRAAAVTSRSCGRLSSCDGRQRVTRQLRRDSIGSNEIRVPDWGSTMIGWTRFSRR